MEDIERQLMVAAIAIVNKIICISTYELSALKIV